MARFTPHPFLARHFHWLDVSISERTPREASQHIAIIDAFAQRAASAEGWTFGVSSNHGPAASFPGVTSRFIQEWPVEKVRYTLDELRTFITQETA